MPLVNVVLWALLTGAVTGGVGITIVLFRRLRRLSEDQRDLLAERRHLLEALDGLTDRVAELQDRVEVAERRLTGGAELSDESAPPAHSDGPDRGRWSRGPLERP